MAGFGGRGEIGTLGIRPSGIPSVEAPACGGTLSINPPLSLLVTGGGAAAAVGANTGAGDGADLAGGGPLPNSLVAPYLSRTVSSDADCAAAGGPAPVVGPSAAEIGSGPLG
jgi:hypothetical protein